MSADPTTIRTRDAFTIEPLSKQRKRSLFRSQRIRITVKGIDRRLVDKEIQKIIDAAKVSGAIVKGPVPLPVKRGNFQPDWDQDIVAGTVHKNVKTHKRLVDIHNPTRSTVADISKLVLSENIRLLVQVEPIKFQKKFPRKNRPRPSAKTKSE